MPSTSYRLVFSDAIGRINCNDEVFTVDCKNPFLAVQGYVKELVAAEKNLIVEVFPVAPVEPLFKWGEVGDGIPVDDEFAPDSSWLSDVVWNGKDSTMKLQTEDGKDMIYKADYDVFKSFKQWCYVGNSAIRFYNSRIKGVYKMISGIT